MIYQSTDGRSPFDRPLPPYNTLSLPLFLEFVLESVASAVDLEKHAEAITPGAEIKYCDPFMKPGIFSFKDW